MLVWAGNRPSVCYVLTPLAAGATQSMLPMPVHCVCLPCQCLPAGGRPQGLHAVRGGGRRLAAAPYPEAGKVCEGGMAAAGGRAL